MDRVARRGSRKVETISRLRPMRLTQFVKKSIFRDSRYKLFSVGGGGVSEKRPQDRTFLGKNRFVSLSLK